MERETVFGNYVLFCNHWHLLLGVLISPPCSRSGLLIAPSQRPIPNTDLKAYGGLLNITSVPKPI